MDRPDRALLGLDLSVASASRIYDYYLGGSHNFEVDRVIAREIIALRPEVPALARSNRAFLRRVVRFMVDAGVTQLIDIGSGIPTVGNVHEVAQAANPAARVIYVDCDPIAVTHSRAILGDDKQTAVIQADLRDVDGIMNAPEVSALIDFSQPVGLLLLAVLHFVVDSDNPAGMVAALAEHVAPGSLLAISHATPHANVVGEARIEELFRSTPTQSALRPAAQIASFFGPFELVEPGFVELSQWRPDEGDTPPVGGETACGGVGILR